MRGIAKYKQSRVESAPPAQVVLMLFQEAVHRLTQSAQVMEANEQPMLWRKNLHHVREIYFELLSALDDEAAPELCAGLRGLYRWCIQELVAAGRQESQQKVLDVLRVTTSLLEGWQGAVAQNR